jgi:phytoene/squalene synthetase
MKLAARVEELLALRDVRPQLDCGLRLLATDSLEQAGRPTRSSTEWHASVFAHDFADLVPALQAGLADLPERRALRPLATLARLALATAREIEASDYGIWEARIELTPVRKLWLAWRERAGL